MRSGGAGGVQTEADVVMVVVAAVEMVAAVALVALVALVTLVAVVAVAAVVVAMYKPYYGDGVINNSAHSARSWPRSCTRFGRQTRAWVDRVAASAPTAVAGVGLGCSLDYVGLKTGVSTCLLAVVEADVRKASRLSLALREICSSSWESPPVEQLLPSRSCRACCAAAAALSCCASASISPPAHTRGQPVTSGCSLGTLSCNLGASGCSLGVLGCSLDTSGSSLGESERGGPSRSSFAASSSRSRSSRSSSSLSSSSCVFKVHYGWCHSSPH